MPTVQDAVATKVKVGLGTALFLGVATAVTFSIGGAMLAGLAFPKIQPEIDITLGLQPTGSIVQMAGWPKKIEGYNSEATPLMVNLDNDSKLEIIHGGRYSISAYDDNGAVLPGWPIRFGDDSFTLSATTATNFDSDPEAEIVFSTVRWFGTGQDKLYVVNHDGTLLPGWPKSLPGIGFEAPAVADINNDGFAEIIIPSFTQGKLFAFTKDGQNVAGWPQAVSYYSYHSPVVSDLNGDGSKEIVFGAWQKLHVFSANGDTYKSCWPMNVGETSIEPPYEGARLGQVAVADLNRDGKKEIVVEGDQMATSLGVSTSKLYAFREDCSTVAGWPATLQARNEGPYIPAIGDVDGNGDIEVVIWDGLEPVYQSPGYIKILNHDGTTLRKLQFEHGVRSFTLADLNGDGSVELLAQTMGNELMAWDGLLRKVGGFPIDRVYPAGMGQLAVGDVDGNNAPDISVVRYSPAMDSTLELNLLTVPFPKTGANWSKVMRDVGNTSSIPSQLCTDGTQVQACNSTKQLCTDGAFEKVQCGKCGVTCQNGYSCNAGLCCIKVNGQEKCTSPLDDNLDSAKPLASTE